MNEESQPLHLLQKLLYFLKKQGQGVCSSSKLTGCYKCKVCPIQVTRLSVCMSRTGSMISIHHVQSVFSVFFLDSGIQKEIFTLLSSPPPPFFLKVHIDIYCLPCILDKQKNNLEGLFPYPQYKNTYNYYQ